MGIWNNKCLTLHVAFFVSLRHGGLSRQCFSNPGTSRHLLQTSTAAYIYPDILSVRSYLLLTNRPSSNNSHQQSPPSLRTPKQQPHSNHPPLAMCFYNTFSFECGCESQLPEYHTHCQQARASRRGSPPCGLFYVHRERITPGKCTSHRHQAQTEKRIRELKDEIKQLKKDIAEYQEDISQEVRVRVARNQSRPVLYQIYGGHGGQH